MYFDMMDLSNSETGSYFDIIYRSEDNDTDNPGLQTTEFYLTHAL